MKESKFCFSKINTLFLYICRILSVTTKNENSGRPILKRKIQNLTIFYSLFFVMSFVNIILYLNSEPLIYEQTIINVQQGEIKMIRNLAQVPLLKSEKMIQEKFNSPKKNILERSLNYQNLTKANFSLNEELNYPKSSKNSMIRLLFSVFSIKIIFTFVFINLYYCNYKKSRNFQNNNIILNEVRNPSNIEFFEDKNYKDSDSSNLQSCYYKTSLHQNTLENLKINNNNLNYINKPNDEIQSKLLNIKTIYTSKIKLSGCISFFNSFEITFQFFMFVNLVRNFNTFSIEDNKFNNIFHFALLYSAFVCIYFCLLDANLPLFIVANLINIIVIVILEKLKITNISFLNNCIFLFIFWIIIYFVIKKLNNNEKTVPITPIRSKTYNEKAREEDFLFNLNYGHLIVNLKEDKREILNNEFKELFQNKFNNNNLEKIISFPKKFLEECKHSKNNEFKSGTLNSIKNCEKQNTKENEVFNYEFPKIIKENEINFSENTFKNKCNNKLGFSEYKLNSLDEINLNIFEFEKRDIHWKKKFIFNNFNLFKIFLEINDFNFDLSEKIVDCYINIRKCLKKYQDDEIDQPEIFTEKETKAVRQNKEEYKEQEIINKKFENDVNFENKPQPKLKEMTFMSFAKNSKHTNFNVNDVNINKSEYNLENNNTNQHLIISNNHFEVINNGNFQKANLNYLINEYNKNHENSIQENLLVEKLNNFFILICKEILKANSLVFLGIIKSSQEKIDKDFSCYGVSVNITENKNFMILKINEIKDEVKFIDMKTEFKFKNLYLKKFCHEFKNPLLNILQLIKNSKQTMKSFSKDNISNYSKNIHLSYQTSTVSNISNNFKNRMTLFKGSTKNFNDIHYNKSSRSNVSAFAGEPYNQNETHKDKNNNLGLEINSEIQNHGPHFKLNNENESISSKSYRNRFSKNLNYCKNMNLKPLMSNNLEEENLISESQNSEKVKFICDNLILSIIDLEFLIEFSNKNLKKLEDLYECENIAPVISENDLFGIDFKKETFDSFNEYGVVEDYKINKNETNVDVLKLIKYFNRIFETKINLIGKKITIFSDLQSCIPDKIIFDEKKLKQIIFNLLSNALKFSSYGKIGIIVEYNRESKNLVFYITDNGIGISQNIIKKIGEPYFKTKNNNNDFGIGMGIYLVKKLVQSLNGEFKIESEINKGTKIILEFPYDLDEKTKIYKESNKILEKKLSKYKTPNISILNSERDRENLEKKLFKNTELKFNSLNQLKNKYEIYDDYCLDSNNLNNPKNKKENLIFSFNEKYRQMSHKEDRRKFRFYSQNLLFNANKLNKEYEVPDKLANQTTLKNLNKNITFDMRKIADLNFNLESDEQSDKNENSNSSNKLANTKSQNNKRSLFNSLIKELNPKIKNNRNYYKRYFTFNDKQIKNSIIPEVCSELENKNVNISSTTINKLFNKNKKNQHYNISSHNLYFVNNITDEDADKLNLSLENSSARETVKINDTLINKNLNSLKKEDGYVFKESDQECGNENNNSIKIRFKNLPNSKIIKKKKNYYKENNNSKSDKTSYFESNLEMNASSPINNGLRSDNETESNFNNIITGKRKPTNIEFIIDKKEISLEKNKMNEQENLKLSMESQSSKKDDNNREIYDSEFSGRFPNEISKNMNYLDVSNIFPLQRSKAIHDSDISSKFFLERSKPIYNSDISSISQIEKSRVFNNSEISSKIQMERDRLSQNLNSFNKIQIENTKEIPNSDSPKKSLIENNSITQSNIESKESSNLAIGNILDDGHLMIMNDNKNSNNIYVVINKEEHLYCHLLSKNIINLETKNIKEEFILSSRSFNKLKYRLPNFDINRCCFISKEQIKNINNIIEQNNIESNININEGDILRILIVDDEKLIRQSQINLIKKYSQKKNILIHIEECEDGIECLYKIYKGLQTGIKYNLIITDETMNFLKGSFMAKIIKKLIAENVIYKIKIIMVTSYGAENYAHLMGSIIEKVYSKPLSINMIENIFKS